MGIGLAGFAICAGVCLDLNHVVSRVTRLVRGLLNLLDAAAGRQSQTGKYRILNRIAGITSP
jgi:hypothetical protein